MNKTDFNSEQQLSTVDIEKYEGEAISAEKEINEKVDKAINSVTASRRWFWELLQNAIDTVDDNKKVKVELEINEIDKGMVLTFRHFGGPFGEARQKYRFDDFKNLINPTSGKSVEDRTTIGKFGTGFLSTHILSLKVDVKGVFENSSNERYEVRTCLDRKNFLLSSDEARSKRIESIIQSLLKYEESKKEKPPVNEKTPIASFTYYLGDNKFNDNETINNIIKDGWGEIKHSLPFVMTFTSKIEEVVIHDKRKNEKISYVADNDPNHINNIDGLSVKSIKVLKNDYLTEKIGVSYLSNEDCTIAWKIEGNVSDKTFANCRKEYKEELKHEMCSLFSIFPLIGSQDFKFPVILHSIKFEPNTERDGINLLEKNKENKRIIESAVNLYEKYLQKAASQFQNLYHICDIQKSIKDDHNWINKAWFNTYKDELKKIILKEKLIDVSSFNTNRKSITTEDLKPQLYFPHININSEISDEKRKIIHIDFFNFAQKLFPGLIPKENILEAWKNILWTDKDKIILIDERALIDRISESKDLESFVEYFDPDDISGRSRHDLAKEWLIKFYDFLINDINNSDLLNYSGKTPKKGIILSRNKNFKLFNQLKKDVGYQGAEIDEDLLKLHNILFPNRDYRDELLLKDISNLVQIKKEQITEESIADEIKKEANDLIKKHDDLLKNINSPDYINRKNIENKLSALQGWIAEKNAERNYFNNYIKQRILQAIIDEKKSNSLIDLLELDRNETKSLEAQSQIMKDPHLDEKLKEGEKALKAIADSDKDFENREVKGKFFENYLKELLEGKFGKGNARNAEGAQDFIIFNQFYVELKTTQGGSEVKVSPEQADEAKQRDKNYYLAVFCYSGDYKDVSIEEFENNLVFSNSFGELITPLVDRMEELKTGYDGKIHIVHSDYYQSFKGMKPYKYVVNKQWWGNMKFNDFVKDIRSKSKISIPSN